MLEEKPEKAKTAWPKNAQPKMFEETSLATLMRDRGKKNGPNVTGVPHSDNFSPFSLVKLGENMANIEI